MQQTFAKNFFDSRVQPTLVNATPVAYPLDNENAGYAKASNPLIWLLAWRW